MKTTPTIILLIIIVIIVLINIFYREPTIQRSFYENNKMYSPCYGIVETVLHDTEKHLKMISVFLRVSDIHSQYFPVNGELISRVKVKGKYKMATSLAKTGENARTITEILTPSGDIVKVEQISGKLARKISDGPRSIGEGVVAGEYLGRIHLGSRVNITFPDTWNVLVEKNQYVKGPDTIIAQLRFAQPRSFDDGTLASR